LDHLVLEAAFGAGPHHLLYARRGKLPEGVAESYLDGLIAHRNPVSRLLDGPIGFPLGRTALEYRDPKKALACCDLGLLLAQQSGDQRACESFTLLRGRIMKLLRSRRSRLNSRAGREREMLRRQRPATTQYPD